MKLLDRDGSVEFDHREIDRALGLKEPGELSEEEYDAFIAAAGTIFNAVLDVLLEEFRCTSTVGVRTIALALLLKHRLVRGKTFAGLANEISMTKSYFIRVASQLRKEFHIVSKRTAKRSKRG